MNRRQIIGMLALPLFLAMATAAMAQKERVARVGILATTLAPTAEQWARSPFRIKLNELGWVEGRNLKIERRHAASASELPQVVLLRADRVIE